MPLLTPLSSRETLPLSSNLNWQKMLIWVCWRKQCFISWLPQSIHSALLKFSWKHRLLFWICSTHCTVIFEVSLHNVSSMDLLIMTNCQVQQSISELIMNRSWASYVGDNWALDCRTTDNWVTMDLLLDTWWPMLFWHCCQNQGSCNSELLNWLIKWTVCIQGSL